LKKNFHRDNKNTLNEIKAMNADQWLSDWQYIEHCNKSFFYKRPERNSGSKYVLSTEEMEITKTKEELINLCIVCMMKCGVANGENVCDFRLIMDDIINLVSSIVLKWLCGNYYNLPKITVEKDIPEEAKHRHHELNLLPLEIQLFNLTSNLFIINFSNLLKIASRTKGIPTSQV
jgi:hypothetical protein